MINDKGEIWGLTERPQSTERFGFDEIIVNIALQKHPKKL